MPLVGERGECIEAAVRGEVKLVGGGDAIAPLVAPLVDVLSERLANLPIGS